MILFDKCMFNLGEKNTTIVDVMMIQLNFFFILNIKFTCQTNGRLIHTHTHTQI